MSPTALLKSTAALTLLLLSAGAAQATPFTYQFQLFDQPGGSTVLGKGSFTADVGSSLSGSCGPISFSATACDDPGNPIVSAFTAALDLSDPFDFTPPSAEFGLAGLQGLFWSADGLGRITDYAILTAAIQNDNTTQFLVVVDARPGKLSSAFPFATSLWVSGNSNSTVPSAECGLERGDLAITSNECVSTTTVPEPGVLALMGLGLTGVTALRRRAAARG